MGLGVDSIVEEAIVFADDSNRLRRLSIDWDYTLVVLSFIVSLLGAYAASQVCSQAATCRSRSSQFYAWTALAAVLFGLCSVWSLHFLAMLAARFDVPVELAPGMTAFSAILAVGFTWLALVSDAFISKLVRHRKRQRKEARRKARQSPSIAVQAEGRDYARVSQDVEAQPLLSPEAVEPNPTAMKQHLMSDSALRAMAFDAEAPTGDIEAEERGAVSRSQSPAVRSAGLASVAEQSRAASRSNSPLPPDDRRPSLSPGEDHHRSVSQRSSRRPSLSFFSRKWSSGRISTAPSSTDLTDSGDKYSSTGGSSDHDFSNSSSASSSGGSNSLVRNLPLTRRERSRLKSGAGLASVPLKELLLTLYGDMTLEAMCKAGIWAVAICAMHYSGMSAFHLKEGFARWNYFLVATSYVIAFVVCLCGVLFMPNMEVNAARQLAFSTLAACGVFAMHYTGMAAATFYTYASPVPDAGYPRYLSLVIVAFGIVTCLVSTTMVSHAATLSRNKLVEMISVKQQLWKTLAQKEAVEATVQLQTEFTSVAAHELRTPLYTITGYVDLLSRTPLDEEQSLYVETVRRACHTIQLITNNVLDWTRLERANDESQARPVFLEIRKFITNLGEITEDRGPKINVEGEGLELIIDIADDVASSIFIDETYLTRILMNLINNANKFCASGYIRVGVRMEGANMLITVEDTGIGIPKRFLETIFQPFRQADTTLTRMNNGSGLGLAICKRLVARCNGELTVISKEGEGSTFLVDLQDIALTSSQIDDTAVSDTSAPYSPASPGCGQTMMIFATNQRVQELITDIWTKREQVVTITPPTLDPEQLEAADFIWTDLPTLLREPELLRLVKNKPKQGIQWPHILVIHSAETELLHLPPSNRVVPIKRPIAIHELAKLITMPKASLPSSKQNKPKLVRFASASSAKSSDSQPSTSGSASSDATAQATESAHISGSASPSMSRNSLQPVPACADAMVTNSDSKKPTILLVEDNLVNAKLGQRMLITLGYDVLLAYNGLEAFEAVKMGHSSIQAVLMDCQMPVMSGQESTSLIRSFELDRALPPLPILALSANVNTASHNALLDVGANAFLSKPISLKQLQEALETHAPSHPEDR